MLHKLGREVILKNYFILLLLMLVYPTTTFVHAKPDKKTDAKPDKKPETKPDKKPDTKSKISELYNESGDPPPEKEDSNHKKKKGEFGVNIIAGFGIQGFPVFDAGIPLLPAIGIDLYLGYRFNPWILLRVNINMTYPFIFPNFSVIPAMAFLFGKRRWKTILNVGIGARFVPYAFGVPPLVSPILKIGVEGRYVYNSGMFLSIGGDIEFQWFYLPFGRIRFTIGTYF